MKIFKFLVKSFLLDFTISYRFVQHIFILLSQVSKLNTLLCFKSVQGYLHSFSSFFHPGFVFLPLHFKDLLLNFVSFWETKYYEKYIFCLTICSSIFLKLSNSELYLVLGLSWTSSSFLVSSIYFLWRSSILFSFCLKSLLILASVSSQYLLKALCDSSLLLTRSLCYFLCLLCIS